MNILNQPYREEYEGSNLVKAGLAIEQNDVAVYNVPFHDVSYPQAVSNGIPIPEFEVLLESVVASGDIVGARMDVAAVAHRMLELDNIVQRYSLGIRQYFGDTFGNRDFVNAQIRVRGNNSASGEINTFSR